MLVNTSMIKSYENRTNVVYVVGLFYWELRYYCIERIELFRSPFTIFVSIPAYGYHKVATMVFNYRNDWYRKNGIYLPLAEMAATEVFQRNAEDNMHFQCSVVEGPAKVSNGELIFKAPPDKDCRDRVNLNLVMLLAHFALSRFTNKL